MKVTYVDRFAGRTVVAGIADELVLVGDRVGIYDEGHLKGITAVASIIEGDNPLGLSVVHTSMGKEFMLVTKFSQVVASKIHVGHVVKVIRD